MSVPHQFKVTFDKEVFELAPDLFVGLIVAPKINNLGDDMGVNALLTHMEEEILNSDLKKETVSDIPTIAAWRRTYSQFGVKPARYYCAAESLIRRVVEHGSLPRINMLVDLCNAVSLKSRIPIASCDISSLSELVIRRAEGTENFHPIGKAEEPESPAAGEIIYADNNGGAHSRRWNWRQSDQVKTTRESTTMLFTVEAVHEEAKVLVEATTSLLNKLLQPYVLEESTQVAFIHPGVASHTFQLNSKEGYLEQEQSNYTPANEEWLH